MWDWVNEHIDWWSWPLSLTKTATHCPLLTHLLLLMQFFPHRYCSPFTTRVLFMSPLISHRLLHMDTFLTRSVPHSPLFYKQVVSCGPPLKKSCYSFPLLTYRLMLKVPFSHIDFCSWSCLSHIYCSSWPPFWHKDCCSWLPLSHRLLSMPPHIDFWS